MRLLSPHFVCAATITGISILAANVLRDYAPVEYLPLLWRCLVVIWTLAMSCVAWISIVRLIEYKNLSDLIAPSLTQQVAQRSFLGTLDFILFRECNILEFFMLHIQRAYGCRGRQRVVIAVLVDTMHCSWREAKKVFKKNHVTKRFGSSWKDFFLPEWIN